MNPLDPRVTTAWRVTGLIFAHRSTPEAWHLDTVLLSCRVLGRSVESAFLAEVMRDLSARGAERLTATFIPTAKNAPAADFLPRHGFVETPDGRFRRETTESKPFDIDHIASRFAGGET